MRDLAAVVERLRLARAARARFLMLWKLTRLERLAAHLAAPAALDRLLADIARAGLGDDPSPLPARCAVAGRRPGGRLGDLM